MKCTIWLRMKLGIRSKIAASCFIIPMIILLKSKWWVWKQMWFYRSQLWNIKLGRAPHVSRFMWKKLAQNTTTQLFSKTHSSGNVIFQTLWCYRLIFDQSLMIHLEIFGQWVSDAYKQRYEPQYCRGYDRMMTWSLKFDQWLVMPEFGMMEQRLLAPQQWLSKRPVMMVLIRVYQWIRAAIFEESFHEWITYKLVNLVWERKGDCL